MPNSTLSVNVRLVVLDVVVRDQAGNPVDGLSTSDFQVFEDGKLQQIRSLEPPSLHTLPQPSSDAGAVATFDPAQPAAFGHSPVDVLLLDQLNTHFADSSFARSSLRDYLEAQPALLPRPTTLLVLFDGGFKSIQGFTRNRDDLLSALATARTKYDWTLEINGAAANGPLERFDQSLRALEQIAQSSASIPARKNLIWVGGGFPSVDPASIDSGDLRQVKDALRHVTDVLLDTRVTLYAVDPSGAMPGMTEITDGSQMAFVQAMGDSFSGNAQSFNAAQDFDQLGLLSGGRVVRGMNDIAHQIASSVDLAARYYTISYTPSSTSGQAAGYRNIKVVCLRPGCVASTRGGYFSGPSQSPVSAAYDLTTAAESSQLFHGLRITVERDTRPNAPPATYIVHAAVNGLSWKPGPDGEATASVYIMAASLNQKDKILGYTLHGMTANAKANVDLRDAGRTADFLFTASPSAKSTTMRFIVRDSATGRIGSVDVPVRKP